MTILGYPAYLIRFCMRILGCLVYLICVYMRILGYLGMRILDYLAYLIRAMSVHPAVLDGQDDREFAAVVTAIAERRRVDRSTAITVTPLFQPMLDRLSLTELKNYLLTRYPNMRGQGVDSNYDIVDIKDVELNSYDKAFLYKDALRITFVYSDAWETVSRFQAVLLNDQL